MFYGVKLGYSSPGHKWNIGAVEAPLVMFFLWIVQFFMVPAVTPTFLVQN